MSRPDCIRRARMCIQRAYYCRAILAAGTSRRLFTDADCRVWLYTAHQWLDMASAVRAAAPSFSHMSREVQS